MKVLGPNVNVIYEQIALMSVDEWKELTYGMNLEQIGIITALLPDDLVIQMMKDNKI
jgi:hypothetical protein